MPIFDRFRAIEENHELGKKSSKKHTTNYTKANKAKNSNVGRQTNSKTPKKHENATKKKDTETTSTTELESSATEVHLRLIAGCECHGTCFRDLQADSVYRHRLNIAELTKQEHDMYLMGVTMACLANRTETNRHKERIRQRASYVFQGKRVCLDAFLYLENVTHYHLKRIRRHVMVNGVIPRVHGNVRKKPHNALSLDIYKFAEHFVKNELQQSKNENLHKSNVVINEPRINLYQKFRMDCIPKGKTMSYSTFRHFLKKQFPNVRFVLNRTTTTGAADGSSGSRDKFKTPKREKYQRKINETKTEQGQSQSQSQSHQQIAQQPYGEFDDGDGDEKKSDLPDDDLTEVISDGIDDHAEDDQIQMEVFSGEFDSYDNDSDANEYDDTREDLYEDVDFLESEDE